MSKELIEQLANPVFGNHPAGCGRRIIGFILDEEVAETLPFGDVSAAFNKLLEAYAQTQGLSIPDGYVLMPIEPTAEMMAAGRTSDGHTLNSDAVYVVYKSMLNAAPIESGVKG
jgi:hypothetical protein